MIRSPYPIWRNRAVLVIALLFCALFAGTLAPSPVRGQAKAPSIGKITYKPANASGGRVARVVGSLVAARGKAVLLIFTNPGKAQISINGDVKGTSDESGLYREEVATNKEYKVVVSAEKYLPFEDEVRVSSSDPIGIPATLTPTFGALHLYNMPAQANLFLDDKRVQYEFVAGTNEVVLPEVLVGNHPLRIDHPDYVEWEKAVDIVPGFEVGVSPELLPAAKIVVSSLPGVGVLLDDINQGLTDNAGKLQVRTPVQPGRHELVLSKAGFVSYTQPVNLARGENVIDVPELEPNPTYTEFAEFFNDGLGLLNVPGTWQWVKNQGAIIVQGSGIGLVKDKSFRDYDFVFNVKFTNNQGAVWILRAKNAQNYYLFQVSVKDRLLRSYVVENGKATAREPSNILVDPGGNTSYQIRAYVQGDRIRHYLKNNTTGDEELMGILVDSRFKYGTVGFATLAGEQFLVEDLIVIPYAESAGK